MTNKHADLSLPDNQADTDPATKAHAALGAEDHQTDKPAHKPSKSIEARKVPQPPMPDDSYFRRLEALRLADRMELELAKEGRHYETAKTAATDVVARATVYLMFLNGEA